MARGVLGPPSSTSSSLCALASLLALGAAAALFFGTAYLRRELELRAEVREAAEACILSKDPTSAACATMEGRMRDVPDWKLRLEPAWSPLAKAPKALAAAAAR